MNPVTALEQPDIWISIAAQLPLVIAFVYFSLKIVNIYQGAQSRLIDQHQEADKTTSERTAKMIEAIVGTWASACDARDKDMRSFLTELSDNQRENDRQLLDVIKENTNALNSLYSAIQGLQLQFAAGAGQAIETIPAKRKTINPPTRPIRSNKPPRSNE